jgi:hypothetical protein
VCGCKVEPPTEERGQAGWRQRIKESRRPIPDLDRASEVLEDLSIFWRDETEPDAKRQFLGMLFEGIWLDDGRVVAVQPTPSFVGLGVLQKPATAAR